MSLVDWLVLIIMIVCVVELVVELKQKRWWAAFVSGLILAFLCVMWRPLLVYLWKKIVP